MSSKKEKRWESKKRKMEAFLEVAKLNESERNAEAKRPKIDVKNASSDGVATDKGVLSHQSVTELANVNNVNATDQKATECDDSTRRTQEELAALRKELRARQKASMEKPKVFLTLEQLYGGDRPSTAPLIFTLDVQHLLLYATQGNIASYKPRWCRLLRWAKVSQVVVVIVNGASASDLKQHTDAAPYLDAKFEMKVELATPKQYGSTVEKELFRVPLSKNKIKGKEERAESCEEAAKFKKMYKNVIPLEPVIKDQTDATGGVDGVISPVDIMLSPLQLMQEGYPLPVKGQYQHYKFTKDKYKQVSDKSPLFAIDCEMCLTTAGKHELTRVSVVNAKSETVYDTLCKPYNTIINYLTRYSGITKKMLQNVTTRLEDVQQVIQDILPSDAILVGQSLNGDLHALQMLHPYIIDTSVIFNLTGDRFKKTGLRRLAAEFLDREIQNDPAGHNSCEDASAAMELVLLKLKKGLLFGDVILGGYQPHWAGWTETNNEELSTQLPENEEESGETEVKRREIESSIDENTEIGTVALIEKRKTFFERPEDSFEDFFDLVKESKRSAVVVGTKDNLASINAEIEKVQVESDKEATKLMKDPESDYFFNCLYLNKFESCDCSDEENTKKTLSKVDKRVRKLMKDVKSGALCAIILTGRITDNSIQNGYCLVNVT